MHKTQVIFDLDGTVCDSKHRVHLLQGDKKDWAAYHSLCDKDAPIKHVIAIMRGLHLDHHITILTGRSEIAKAKTIAWLGHNKAPYHDLVMRPADNDLDPVTLKAQWADIYNFTCDNTLCAFDDDPFVADMWSERGIPCLQINEIAEAMPRFRMRRVSW